MPLEVEERPDVAPLGDRDRTRRHHHDAETDDAGDRQQQPRIVAAARTAVTLGLDRAQEVEHQRTFRVARPISTSTTLMIQKRTITRGSGQPFSSKWWWIGAMRKMRLPVSL